MEDLNQSEYVTRDSIMRLLSDDEIARVSTAEAGSQLSAGDEYLDMEHFEEGVQEAKAMTTPMGHVLSRNSVRDETWKAILMQLTLASAAKSVQAPSR